MSSSDTLESTLYRNVSTGATGTTVVAPKFLDILTKISPQIHLCTYQDVIFLHTLKGGKVNLTSILLKISEVGGNETLKPVVIRAWVS